MNLLISAAGEVLTENEWRAWTDKAWAYAKDGDYLDSVPQPADYWERMKRVLGLEAI